MTATLDTYRQPSAPKPIGNYRGHADPAEYVHTESYAREQAVEEAAEAVRRALRSARRDGSDHPTVTLEPVLDGRVHVQTDELIAFAEACEVLGAGDLAVAINDYLEAVRDLERLEEGP